MRKKRYRAHLWSMLRLRDVEKLIYTPDIHKILDVSEINKLWEERNKLEQLIWEFYPCPKSVTH